MFRDFSILSLSSGISTLALTAQAANGSLDFVATIAALGTFLTVFVIAAGKIWGLFKGVHDELKEFAEKSKADAAAVREDNKSLRENNEYLQNTLGSAHKRIEHLEKLENTVEELRDAIETLEVQLIQVTSEREKYRKLWQDREGD